MAARCQYERTHDPDRVCIRLMTLGESGLGKSTVVACLADNPTAVLRKWSPVLNAFVECDVPGDDSTSVTTEYQYEFQEVDPDGRPVTVTYHIIDSPGFASRINNANSWVARSKEIERRFDKADRLLHTDHGIPPTRDPRITVCLYFLAPNCRPLKPLDIHVLTELQPLVPVILLIAKADTLTAADMQRYKELLRDDLIAHSIQTVGYPSPITVEGHEVPHDQFPLAVIASKLRYVRDGDGEWALATRGTSGAVPGRLYQWGLAECNAHSDLGTLRRILATTFSNGIRDTGHALFGNWRRSKRDLIAAAEAELDEQWRQYRASCCRLRPPPLEKGCVAQALDEFTRQRLASEEIDEAEWEMRFEVSRGCEDNCVAIPAGGLRVEEAMLTIRPASEDHGRVRPGDVVLISGAEMDGLVPNRVVNADHEVADCADDRWTVTLGLPVPQALQCQSTCRVYVITPLRQQASHLFWQKTERFVDQFLMSRDGRGSKSAWQHLRPVLLRMAWCGLVDQLAEVYPALKFLKHIRLDQAFS